MRYAVASLNRHREEVGYRYYFTELVRMQAEGKTFSESLQDMLHPKPTDVRTADEIATEVSALAGLEVRDGTAQSSGPSDGEE